MTAWDDMNQEMQPPALDGETAERLLTGRVALADAPPGYDPVLRVFAAASAEARPEELVREREAVLAFAAAVRSRRSVTAAPFRLSRARVAVVVAAVVAATTGLAAAGTLPGPAQELASRLLEKVGISVPSSTGPERTPPSGHGLMAAPAPMRRDHPTKIGVAGAVAVIRVERGAASSGSKRKDAAQTRRVTPTGTSPRGGRESRSPGSASFEPHAREAAATAKPTAVEQEPAGPKPTSKAATQTRKSDSAAAARPSRSKTTKRPATTAASNNPGGRDQGEPHGPPTGRSSPPPAGSGTAAVTKPSDPGKVGPPNPSGGAGSGNPQNPNPPAGGNGSGAPPNPGPPSPPPNPGSGPPRKN